MGTFSGLVKPTKIPYLDGTYTKNKNFYRSDLDTFHNAIGPALLFARLLGAMPLSGVMNRDPSRVKFRWMSFGVMVTFAFILGGLAIAIAYTIRLAKDGVAFRKIDQPSYLFSVLMICILFLFLAKKWPKLIQFWTEIDMVFLKPPYPAPKRRLSMKVRAAMIIGVTLRWVETLIGTSRSLYYYMKRFEICNNSYPPSFEDYLVTSYPTAFELLGFSTFSVGFLMWLGLLFTFFWALPDTFVVMVSFGIATRFEQLNARVEKLEGLNISENVWKEIRIDYVRICELLEAVDDCFSPITLLMCANNLFFICCQFLKAFGTQNALLSQFYLWYSLLYLVTRTIVSFLCAATIKDQSKVALKTLHKVPTESWCTEIQRLIWQINVENIALSGMKFFYISRKLLFAMAGTIVTYELVLLQIDEPYRRHDAAELCV